MFHWKIDRTPAMAAFAAWTATCRDRSAPRSPRDLQLCKRMWISRGWRTWGQAVTASLVRDYPETIGPKRFV